MASQRLLKGHEPWHDGLWAGVVHTTLWVLSGSTLLSIFTLKRCYLSIWTSGSDMPNFCCRICIYTSTADLFLCRSAAFMQVSCVCPRPCLDRMESNITWWWLILPTANGIAELSEGHNCQPSSHYSHKIRQPKATFLSLNKGAISNLWNNISNPATWSSCKDQELVLTEWAVFS